MEAVKKPCGGVDNELVLLSQPPIGEGNAHGMRTNEIQQQVGRGEYRVDTQAVADAILRRLLTPSHGRGMTPADGDHDR